MMENGRVAASKTAFSDVIGLVVVGAILLAIYLYLPEEPKTSASSIFEDNPITPDFISLKYTLKDDNKELGEIRILDVCVDRNLCEKIRVTLGLSDTILSKATRQSGSAEYCCRAVLQHWLVSGSTPKDKYPRTWNSVIKLLGDVELQEVADHVKKALPTKI